MKTKVVSGVVILLSFVLITGCSFNVSKLDVLKFIPLADKGEKTQEDVTKETEPPVKSLKEVSEEVTGMVDQMVSKISAGNWNEAIKIGEEADKVLTAAEKNVLSGKTTKPAGAVQANFYSPTVQDHVYTIDSLKEKLYETLVEAYDFKNHLEKLSKEEKECYIRAARNHYNINVTEPFKKLALAKMLIDVGELTEGLQLATEVYNTQERNADVTDTYAWALYLSGKKIDAYNIYSGFYPRAVTLSQLMHCATVVEEQNKLLGLVLYRACIKYGNNLMVKEPNVNNISSQSYINMIANKSQQAVDRLLAGGFGVDSQYKMDDVQYVNIPKIIWL